MWKDYTTLLNEKVKSGEIRRGQLINLVIYHLKGCYIESGSYICNCKHNTKLGIKDSTINQMTVIDTKHVLFNGREITTEKDGIRSLKVKFKQ